MHILVGRFYKLDTKELLWLVSVEVFETYSESLSSEIEGEGAEPVAVGPKRAKKQVNERPTCSTRSPPLTRATWLRH